MRDVSLTLTLVSGPAAEYNCDAHLAAIETSAGSEVTYQTLCADGSFSEIGQSSYALHIVAAQDWSATGLARFLWDNEGELCTFEYQAHGATVPPADATPGMTGTIRLIAPNYGGEAENYAELDVTMPCTAKPTIALAPFAAAAAAEAEPELEPEPVAAAAAAEAEPELEPEPVA
jgi:hypothetical protein